jgi:hypothetical protein
MSTNGLTVCARKLSASCKQPSVAGNIERVLEKMLDLMGRCDDVPPRRAA